MESSLLHNIDGGDENSDSSPGEDLETSELHLEPSPDPEAARQGWCSPAILICISHALSAWGDRMWAFAISLLLISLTPNSLRLTATYGVSVSLSVVAFGALVGDWIDATPRLKAARLTLIIQNVAVVACAGVFFFMLVRDTSKTLFHFLEFVMIVLAIVARLSSLGTTIAIERDWVVVIAKGNKSLMAGTNAILRRIDLTTNILAPVITGLIMRYGSKIISICFIAGWNVLSLFAEYSILTSVYSSCPALAYKAVDLSRHPETVSDKDSSNDDNFQDLNLDDNSTDGTILVPRVKTVRNFKSTAMYLGKKVRGRARTFLIGFKLYFKQRIALAGLGLACLYLTVLGFDSITTGYAYSQHLNPAILGGLTAAGALTGIIGTFIFPVFRETYGIVRTGIISMSIQLFFLLFCVASVWAPGHPGHLLDPFAENNVENNVVSTTTSPDHVATTSTERLLSSSVRATSRCHLNTTMNRIAVHATSTMFPYTVSSSAPTSTVVPVNFNNTSVFSAAARSILISPSSAAFSPTSVSPTIQVTVNIGKKTTSNGSTSNDANHKPSSYISLGLLMGGIVMSRTGLWMTDLVITQLFQENIAEQERGIVGGVQNSFNNVMDVAHFVLVTVAPKPEQFGSLILVSVAMVSLGFSFYARFAWNVRKRLLQLEKLSQWSASNESMEGSSRRLRQDNTSSSQEEMMKGVLTVENENYS